MLHHIPLASQLNFHPAEAETLFLQSLFLQKAQGVEGRSVMCSLMKKDMSHH